MPKITDYNAGAGSFTPILTDLLYGVDDPLGSPDSGAIEITALRDLLEATLVNPVISGNLAWGTDLFLERDTGAGTGGQMGTNLLAQRNGTNPQELRVYKTFTNDTNYERVHLIWYAPDNQFVLGTGADGTGSARTLNIVSATHVLEISNETFAQNLRIFNTRSANGVDDERGILGWSGNFFRIGTENGGTGTDRLTQFIHNGVLHHQMDNNGLQMATDLRVNVQGDGYFKMQEVGTQPSATVNSASIFAEDNGSGKTRLMVRFGTGAVQEIAIEP